MNCHLVQNSIVEYLLDELDQQTYREVDQHLESGCPQCQEALNEAIEGVDLLFESLPAQPMNATRKQQILSFALNTSVIDEIPEKWIVDKHPQSSATSERFRIVFPCLLSFAAGIALMVSFEFLAPNDRSFFSAPWSRSNVGSKNFPSLHFPDTLAMSQEKYEKSLLISLHQQQNSGTSSGYILWDSLSHQVHFFAEGIAQPKKGSKYFLWLETPDGQAHSVTPLEIDPTGKCKTIATFPLGEFKQVYVTLESDARSSQPSRFVELTSGEILASSFQM